MSPDTPGTNGHAAPSPDAGPDTSQSAATPVPQRGEPVWWRDRSASWGLVLVAVGIVWLLALAGVPIDWELLLPGALVVIGVLLLVGLPRGTCEGLVGLGVVVAVVAALTTITPPPSVIGIGDRTHTVATVGDLAPDYGLGMGSLTVDLRSLDLPEGTTEVDVGLVMGELIVRVPDDVTVRGVGRAGMGDVEALDMSSGGIAPRLEFDDPGADPGRILVLDLKVGLGRVEVSR